MAILIFLVTILVLVVIHEFGHFIIAKKFGIKVLEFGFGLPPRIWGKKVGETLVSINWIPAGGFVKLLGEDEEDKEVLNDKRSFARALVWKKILVVIAGVVMNLLLAWVLFYGVLITQNYKIPYPAIEPTVQVDQVQPNMPAANSPIRSGDKVLSVNGQKIQSPEQMIDLIKATKDNEAINVTVSDIDGGDIRSFSITPKVMGSNDKKIGVAFNLIPYKTYVTPTEKLFSGILYSWDATRYTFLGLGNLFNDLGQRNFQKASQSVSGPIGLADMTPVIVSIGLPFYVWFVGIMSLTLAIFNVLPIPALDGGRLFFLLIEFITHKKVSPDFERKVHGVGMIVLLGLIVLISASDIWKHFNRL